MKRSALAALLLILTAPLALAAEISCRVVGVSDGDTFTCLTAEKRQVKVRMSDIDTPESKQPYGTRARQALSDLVFGKDVRIVVRDTDHYGRTVARTYVGATDVNAALVSQGAAWVYRKYSRDRSLIALEDQARAAKRGLWSLPESERIPPWEWRRAGAAQRQAQRDTAGALRLASSTDGSYSCSPRKACGQMTSCAEARFHLEQCGSSRLDGNRDGVPCEKLCR